jgi:anti-anti-sigma regulatory factor
VRAVETRFFTRRREAARVDLQPPIIASLGIRLLIQAIKTVSARGGRLLLLNPAPSAASALDISGLGQYVVRGSEAEAAAAVLQPSK